MSEVRNLATCDRCGEEHTDLLFKAFVRPTNPRSEPVLTHWAVCPTNGDPILMRIETPTERAERLEEVLRLIGDEERIYVSRSTKDVMISLADIAPHDLGLSEYVARVLSDRAIDEVMQPERDEGT